MRILLQRSKKFSQTLAPSLFLSQIYLRFLVELRA